MPGSNIIATLLLFAQLPVVFGSFMCYQCATDSAIINWSRFRLPMVHGDSMIGDDLCFHEESVQSHIPCSGMCVTMNVTSESGATIAVVRDCHYLSEHKKEELRQTDDNCITKEVMAHRKMLTVRYCYCKGEFCNGKQPLRRTIRRGSPSEGSMSLPSHHLFLIAAFLPFL